MPAEHVHRPLIKCLAKVILNKSPCRTNTHCHHPHSHAHYHTLHRTPADSKFLKDLAACYLHIALPPSDPRLEPSESQLTTTEVSALPQVTPTQLRDLVFEILNWKYMWGPEPPQEPPIFKELSAWKPAFSKVRAVDLERVFKWMRRHEEPWFVRVEQKPERWRRRALRMYRDYEDGQVV